jgi:hypothetical protein
MRPYGRYFLCGGKESNKETTSKSIPILSMIIYFISF